MATVKEKIKSLPTTPGVYLYKDAADQIIYVGKAVNLQRRVKQYFEKKESLTPKTQQLVDHIADISFIKTITEFDALLLEANLIQKYQPKYNAIAKDDKSPIYISIPKNEEMPRITLTRKPDDILIKTHFFAGPFQSTRVARSIVRSIRHFIPFCTQRVRNGKPCFYTHIGLCNPCPSAIVAIQDMHEKKAHIQNYRKNIFKIIRILKGNLLPVLSELEREMKKAADAQSFETAAQIRDKIVHMKQLLDRHFDPSQYVQDAVAIGETVQSELNDLATIVQYGYPNVKTIAKVECIDISNTTGSDPVGSLVVMIDGIIDRSQYRKFTIHDIQGPNDTAMIYQVITRRFHHSEWTYPDVLLIDGGKGQVAAAQKALSVTGVTIPIIGLAKRYESLVIPVNGIIRTIHLESDRPAIQLLKRIRDESHRFAVSFHRLKRAKAFMTV